MGGACCIAARDRSIVGGPRSEILQRNIRHSPTWSFRWDNRGRVAGEETSISWFPDGMSRNHGPGVKHQSPFTSQDGSSLENFQSSWNKSSVSEGTAEHVTTPASDQFISRNISTGTSLEQVKETTEFHAVSNPSPMNLSVSLPLTSSSSTSSLSSKSCLHPAGSVTQSWLPHHSPGNQLTRQISDTQVSGLKSPNGISVNDERPTVPSWSNDSSRGSYSGPSDGWSMHAFSELMATSHRERWSFDNESLGFHQEKSRSSIRTSDAPYIDLQTCGVCSRLLTEKSLWSTQKLIATNELSVVSVLTCGHVFHAECLETMTPEMDKYDPACPVCTLGEKHIFKLSQKALKVEMDWKAKNKRSRNQALVGDLDGDPDMFDCQKASGHERKGPKMDSSSSMKGSLVMPFLRRHFSFQSKGSRSLTDHTTKKKGFFWTRSMKARGEHQP
uniref:RING-type domain-containing protein n=1 Tax=Rhizophora mucronata TaxID=61149 RepID=A0A2P2LCK8_RHIMU